MTVVLSIAVVALLFQLVHFNMVLHRQRIVSEIADSRRKLFALLDAGIVDVESEFFRFFFRSMEMLIRIRYFRKYNQLPQTLQLLEMRVPKDVQQKSNAVKSEIAALKNGEYSSEIDDFLKTAFPALFDGMVKSKFMLVVLGLSKIAILLSKLGIVKLKYSFAGAMALNDEIKSVAC